VKYLAGNDIASRAGEKKKGRDRPFSLFPLPDWPTI
jgi:hypothetical protein